MKIKGRAVQMGRGRYKLGAATGGAHLYIPSAWLKAADVEAGDYVQLYLGENGDLIVTPEKKGGDGEAA